MDFPFHITLFLESQLEHANRAIRQLDEERCPELYFLKRGKWVTNEHTPLAWTQANFGMALEYLERAKENHFTDLARVYEDPVFTGLWADPRLQKIVKR